MYKGGTAIHLIINHPSIAEIPLCSILKLKILNESKAELSATTQVLFRIKNIKPAATLEFVKDGTGKVIKFIVNQEGVYEWKKID